MKPINFSTEMVQAILDGRKSQTRRVIKPQPMFDVTRDSDGNYGDTSGGSVSWMKPKYQKGDILYVDESWNTKFDLPLSACIRCSNECKVKVVGHFIYKVYNLGKNILFRAAKLMPKEAARIFLRVTDVRAERVQDITEEDAIDEGCQGKEFIDSNGEPYCWDISPEEQYKKLWNSIYTKRGYPWEINPWVWVCTFERVEKPKEEYLI